MSKGYRKGQPDLKLKCKDGDRTDIIVIELRNTIARIVYSGRIY